MPRANRQGIRRRHRPTSLDVLPEGAARRSEPRARGSNGSADTEATPGIWGMFTVDEERGLLFIPVEKVEGNDANDYWGGGNHGNNLYSDSLVALDAATGKMKWFQQLVHHDIWDYDIAAAPVLDRRAPRTDGHSRGRAADEDGAAVHLQPRDG